MIDRAFITEWQQTAPWPQRYQVEQDLVICRALVEIFNQPVLADKLAFRGGPHNNMIASISALKLNAVKASTDLINTIWEH